MMKEHKIIQSGALESIGFSKKDAEGTYIVFPRDKIESMKDSLNLEKYVTKDATALLVFIGSTGKYFTASPKLIGITRGVPEGFLWFWPWTRVLPKMPMIEPENFITELGKTMTKSVVLMRTMEEEIEIYQAVRRECKLGYIIDTPSGFGEFYIYGLTDMHDVKFDDSAVKILKKCADSIKGAFAS